MRAAPFLLVLPGLLLPPAAGAASDAPRSEHVASYEIRAALLPEERTVRGEEWVLFRNPGPQAVTSLWFHLYANAFRNAETVFLRESRQGTDLLGKEETIRRGTWGWIQIDSVRLETGADLAGSVRFRETLMEVPLPAPVPPGKTVRIAVGFRTRLPRTIARMGYRGDHFDVMQWFPKLAGLRDGGWNLHDFHADSEFFADFGAYDVTLSVPPEYEVEATGVPVGAETDADGSRVLRYRAEDVHDFAWAADPRFGRATAVHRGVEIVYLHQPAHRRHADRILAAVRTCLDFYGDHLMEYPYPRIVIDDLPMGLSGGMEYPMLFTITIHWAQPRFVRSPEGVTIHEFGHQYWYGILASNEFEEPWLDEGVNSYVSSLVEDVHWGLPQPGRTGSALFRFAAARVLQKGIDLGFGGYRAGLADLLGFHGGPFHLGGTRLLPFRFNPNALHLDGFADPNLLEGRDAYLPVARTDPIATRAWEFLPGSYSPLVYDKTYLFLKTLERTLGRDTMLAGLREYVRRNRFLHPAESDLRAALEEAAGRDLGPYFEQLLHGTGAVDFSLASVEVEPVRGAIGVPQQERVGDPVGEAVPAPAHPETASLYRSEVVVRRDGEVQLPVAILLRFEDGTEIRETWDGRDRWKRLVHVLPSRLATAEIDPDHHHVLDRDRNDNSWTAATNWKAVAKVSAILLFWFQNLLHLLTALS